MRTKVSVEEGDCIFYSLSIKIGIPLVEHKNPTRHVMRIAVCYGEGNDEKDRYTQRNDS